MSKKCRKALAGSAYTFFLGCSYIIIFSGIPLYRQHWLAVIIVALLTIGTVSLVWRVTE